MDKENEKNIRAELNHIYFYSEVDRTSVHELIQLLKDAEEYCLSLARITTTKVIPIYLHINSFGGCIFSAFNAIDYITASCVPVHTIIEGSTASAGTLISICGKKRYMRPHSHMLIHQLSSECWGKMNEIDDQYNNLKGLMVKIKNLYKSKTTIPDRALRRLLKKDLWLDSEQCLEYSLVDKLWTK